MLENLIIDNEKKIEKFEIDYYLENKDYPIAAALSALETTNEIQKCFFDDKYIYPNMAYNVLRLYALLQSLFVSIDSLYALAYSLTKSKSFININKNQDLRELKYIRNDVVGHPANRMLNSSTQAYCILDNSSVTSKSFCYNIYSGKGIENKKIDLIKIVNSYYIECNNLLDELFNIAKNDKRSSILIRLASKAIDTFSMGGDYYPVLLELKREYLEKYTNAKADQHRFLWRLELIEKLMEYQCDDEEILDLKDYAIGIEIIKIYQLLSGKLYKLSLGRRTPYLLSSFYRFLNKNKSMVAYIDKITDLKNPLFENSMSELLKTANAKNVTGPIKYLNLLNDFFIHKEDGLLYAFSIPIKEYKKNSR